MSKVRSAKARCPVCNGRRGRYWGPYVVTKSSEYGSWSYERYVHPGYHGKRKYCYEPLRQQGLERASEASERSQQQDSSPLQTIIGEGRAREGRTSSLLARGAA